MLVQLGCGRGDGRLSRASTSIGEGNVAALSYVSRSMLGLVTSFKAEISSGELELLSICRSNWFSTISDSHFIYSTH